MSLFDGELPEEAGSFEAAEAAAPKIAESAPGGNALMLPQ